MRFILMSLIRDRKSLFINVMDMCIVFSNSIERTLIIQVQTRAKLDKLHIYSL